MGDDPAARGCRPWLVDTCYLAFGLKAHEGLTLKFRTRER
jgi:hypothetical protein